MMDGGKAKKLPAGKEMQVTFEESWIDVTTTPKRMSWPLGMKNYSIYKIEGDRLTICYAERPKDSHPTKFVSEKNSPNDRLMVLQRVKTAYRGQAPPLTRQPQEKRPISPAYGSSSSGRIGAGA